MRTSRVGFLLAVVSVLSVAPASAGRYLGNGNFSGQVASSVTRLFVQFPAGGPGLSNAVAAMLISTPALADDVAFAATSASGAQQSAVADGMAAAQLALNGAGNSAGAGDVSRAAVQSGNATLAASASAARGSGGVASNLFLPSGDPSTTNPALRRCVTTTDNTVSPTTATLTCQ